LKGNIMLSQNFLRNAALVFGLLTAGASYAEETTAPVPPGPGSSYATEIRSKMANMTPDQRAAYRKEMEAKMETMTPEERKAFRQEMASQRRSQMASMTPAEREAFRDKVKAERQERHQQRENMHSDDMHGAGARGR
jgi:hypothetical protein